MEKAVHIWKVDEFKPIYRSVLEIWPYFPANRPLEAIKRHPFFHFRKVDLQQLMPSAQVPMRFINGRAY